MEEKSKYFEEKTISTVKNMIRKNISIQDICDITGMSLDEIRKIEDSMEQTIFSFCFMVYQL